MIATRRRAIFAGGKKSRVHEDEILLFDSFIYFFFSSLRGYYIFNREPGDIIADTGIRFSEL